MEIRNKIGVIGLGYVGLPLAVAFAEKDFEVFGFDVDAKKNENVNQGVSYIEDIPSAKLKKVVDCGNLKASADFQLLREVRAVIVCVPTPLGKAREPDLSCVMAALKNVRENLQKNQLIILESTTYPGMTEEVVLPFLEESGFKVGVDCFLSFSPERIDPANKKYGVKNTPKVVGGVTSQCLELACALYENVVDQVVPVSSPTVAELVKLLENSFRAVNIGFVNEMAVICHKLGVEVSEVIRAAATKPFGFMPFMPGPGLGGHCIPVDPQYLSWKMKSLKYHPRFIQLAEEVNIEMPHYVVRRVSEELNFRGKALRESSILVLGISYKKDVSDVRESPAIDVIENLHAMGANVSYFDPHVDSFQACGRTWNSLASLPADLSGYDSLLILTDHSSFDYPEILSKASFVFDARNVTVGMSRSKEKVVRL